MHEEPNEAHLGRPVPPVPEDAVRFGVTGSYEVYTSPGRGTALISTIDYHPGRLVLQIADLEDLLERMRSG